MERGTDSRKRDFLKRASAIGGVGLAALALPSALSATTLQDGSLVSPASYIIFKDGGQIKSKNGLTGTIEYAGTNAANIFQSTINAVSAGGGTVSVRAGTYSLNTTVLIKPKVRLEMETGVVITPSTNTNIFDLMETASISGGRIDTTGILFTGAAILCDGTPTWRSSDVNGALSIRELTKISDVFFSGNFGAGTGTAILLRSDNSSNLAKRVYSLICRDIKIYGFEHGIYLNHNGTLGYLNGNHFDNIYGIGTVNFIKLSNAGGSVGTCDGNFFTNIDYQATPESQSAIIVDGGTNCFSGRIWDWQNKNTSPYNAHGIMLLSSSQQSYVNVSIGPGSITDNGQNNTIINPRDTTVTIKSGGHIKVEGTWNGSHFVMGSRHIWVDSSGKLRIKNGAPSSDADGTVLGT